MLLLTIISLEFVERSDDDEVNCLLPVGLLQRTRNTTKRSK
jgi:hypothetical protein